MSVYDGLVDGHGPDGPHPVDGQWAFGTGFTADPAAAEIDAPVPEGVAAADLAEYCLMLGDDALVLSHRLTEWVSNAPELEEEVALANIALDLLGQARPLLARAGRVEERVDGQPARDEDTLAHGRTEPEFRCAWVVEPSDGLDFARCIARLLVFSTWRLALFSRLVVSADPALAAVAAKGVPELAYHRDHAARWTVRLGDGTPLSHTRMQAGLDRVWPDTGELFRPSAVESRLAGAGVAVDPASLRPEVDGVLDRVLAEATLVRPTAPPAGPIGGRGGREGVHTEHLGHLLGVAQSLARQHPGAVW